MMYLPAKYSELTSSDRRAVREEYVRLQNGRCMWCHNLLTENPPASITSKHIDWDLFPKEFLKHPVHLQHCHKTDRTEGAVHAICNAYMWYYEGR